jgi:hypothetical protein
MKKKILVSQSILWAASIVATALLHVSGKGDFSWLLLTVIASVAIGMLQKEL